MPVFRPARLCALALAAALAACATPTPYGPLDRPGGYGFSEQRVEEDRFIVRFSGNASTASEVTQDFALLRAADLTLQEGYDWFEVVRRSTEVENRYGGGSGVSVGLGGASGSRGSSVGVGVGLSFPLGGADTDGAAASLVEIKMGRGERPDGLNVYDARDVALRLRSQTR